MFFWYYLSGPCESMNASAAKAQWSRESNLKFSWVDRHDRWRGPSKWISWRGRFAFYCRFSLHEILGNNHDFVESIICHQDHKLTNDALAEFYEHVSEHDLVPGVVFHRKSTEHHEIHHVCRILIYGSPKSPSIQHNNGSSVISFPDQTCAC